MRRGAALLAVVAVVVLALDVATKVWVVAELEGRRTLELLGGPLLIRVSRNPGAAFSFAAPPCAYLLRRHCSSFQAPLAARSDSRPRGSSPIDLKIMPMPRSMWRKR